MFAYKQTEERKRKGGECMAHINTETLNRYMAAEGIHNTNQLAKRMGPGIHFSTVYRVVSGETEPSGKVIAGLHRAFPGRNITDLIAA